ncbi:MAG: 50S ribosomal protein L19e [Methanosarcinales archaeon Met12]|nr:MAG: 50S ribosomal protein L19e [Methanosarcinales archaeon Met12]
MANLSNQRRMAASIMKVGETRVWMTSERLEDIAAAITREDIRTLVSEGVITSKPQKGISRGRARAKKVKRTYGHRKGHGSRRGAKGARAPRKEQWMKKIRALRRRLRTLREEETIDTNTYRKFYNKARGGEFRSVAHLNSHLESKQ